MILLAPHPMLGGYVALPAKLLPRVDGIHSKEAPATASVHRVILKWDPMHGVAEVVIRPLVALLRILITTFSIRQGSMKHAHGQILPTAMRASARSLARHGPQTLLNPQLAVVRFIATGIHLRSTGTKMPNCGSPIIRIGSTAVIHPMMI